MSKVLMIKASPLPDEVSRSAQVANVFLENYRLENPNDEVEVLELYQMDIPLIDLEFMQAGQALAAGKDLKEIPESTQQKMATYGALTEQFMAADKYIFVYPLWNLSIPPVLKAYIDTFVVAGKTFRYTEHGAEGLLKNKKAIQIHGSGGVYSNLEFNYSHGEPYVKTILGFIGAEVEPTIFVEGIDHDPSREEEIVAAAKKEAAARAKTF
ncbi:NAD(P)H-dependent oxidoreductase [Listeria costaricensis]|uniref:NAD(P)H-dependent oxidoreductase n=1 Tax=Listeria costaricensis TaxID=2026604 RepID=UPI000C06A403|nr:FMN-dependent NADH-azoreductase [Listeria costaricensis]